MCALFFVSVAVSVNGLPPKRKNWTEPSSCPLFWPIAWQLGDFNLFLSISAFFDCQCLGLLVFFSLLVYICLLPNQLPPC